MPFTKRHDRLRRDMRAPAAFLAVISLACTPPPADGGDVGEGEGEGDVGEGEGDAGEGEGDAGEGEGDVGEGEGEAVWRSALYPEDWSPGDVDGAPSLPRPVHEGTARLSVRR